MILGFTGSYCCGKDTVANYIVDKYGFAHFSLSDIIREEMKKANVDTTRENLIVFGTRLRQENGNGVLADLAIKKIQDGAYNYCITSIRHPAEVLALKKQKNFTLINVDAPSDVRFERMLKRKRAGDPQTLEKFNQLEKKESQSSGAGQQLANTAALADITFINDFPNLDLLYKAIDEILNKLTDKKMK